MVQVFLSRYFRIRVQGLGPGFRSNLILFLNYSEIKDRCNPKIIENNKELQVDDTNL